MFHIPCNNKVTSGCSASSASLYNAWPNVRCNHGPAQCPESQVPAQSSPSVGGLTKSGVGRPAVESWWGASPQPAPPPPVSLSDFQACCVPRAAYYYC